MSLSELKDPSWAKTVFQISPVGDVMYTTVRPGFAPKEARRGSS
jgi:hypothetical protein